MPIYLLKAKQKKTDGQFETNMIREKNKRAYYLIEISNYKNLNVKYRINQYFL